LNYTFVALSFDSVFHRISLRHFFELLLLLKLHKQGVILRSKSIVINGIAHSWALIITIIKLLQLIGHVRLYGLVAPV